MSTVTKQEVYDFYLDEKVTTWYRTSFEIEAANEAAAREIAENASKQLLANAVMEYFEIEFVKA